MAPSIRAAFGFADTPTGSVGERAAETIVAGAIGDAFGYAGEFSRLDAIREQCGGGGLTEPARNDGTQMTLFTLESLIRAGERRGDINTALEGIRDAYLDWYATQHGDPRAANLYGRLGAQPALWRERAPGVTCLSALAEGDAERRNIR